MKNELNEKHNVLNNEIGFLNELVKSASPEKVAYAIIKEFCDERCKPSSELRYRFYAWLIIDDTEVKNKALEMYFNKVVEETMSEESPQETQVAGGI